jgi:hypothetical protein
MHKILCESREKSYEDHQNDSTSIRWPTLESCAGIQWHDRFKNGRTSVDNEAQEDPQAAQLLKLLHKFNSSTVRIDIGQFMTLLRRWELTMEHANGLWRKNWKEPRRNQICGQDPDSWREVAARKLLHWPSLAHVRWRKFLVKGHQRWWELGLRLRPWDKATILPVEKPHVTKAKKGRHVKSNVKRMIITFFDKVIVPKICPNRPNSEFRVLLRSFTATKRKLEKTSPQTLAGTELPASP